MPNTKAKQAHEKETFRCEYVRCGKGCAGCPHGPYWYGYRRSDGKLRKRYIGKLMPDEARQREDNFSNRPDYWAHIFSRSTATVSIAKEILGVPMDAGHHACRIAFRKLAKKHHPDRGGNQEQFKFYNAAWTYLNALAIW